MRLGPWERAILAVAVGLVTLYGGLEDRTSSTPERIRSPIVGAAAIGTGWLMWWWTDTGEALRWH